MRSNQGANVERKEFGITERETAQAATEAVVTGSRVRLFDEGAAVGSPRIYTSAAVTDGAGVAVFTVEDEDGADMFTTYSHISACVNSSMSLYAVEWSRADNVVTVAVKEIAIVALALDYAAAVGVSVSLLVMGGA